MKKASIILILLLLAALPFAGYAGEAELQVTWTDIKQTFPEEGEAVYTYTCRYPALSGIPAAEGINDFYRTTVSEMVELVLPMYANDEDMAFSGGNAFDQVYEITCNNGRYFSTRMLQKQILGDREIATVHSQVFDVSGAYAGEMLTLRGLLEEVGESSAQLADAIFEDIWQKIEKQQADVASPWNQDLDKDTLGLDFFPEEHFYADEEGRAVFYLQPGLFRQDQEIVTFTYTAQEVLALLTQK